MKIGKCIDKSRLQLIITIVIFIILEIPYLSSIRPVMYDEAWYSSTGYNFYIGNGFYNTIVGSGGNANFVLPLFIGIFFRIFGASLFSARLVAVVSGIIFIFILYKILNLLNIIPKIQIVAYATFLSLPFFNTVFRFARPESIAIVFFISAIYFHLNFITRSNYLYIIYTAVNLLIAFLSHPFSSIFFLLIGLNLFIISIHKRDIKLLKYIVLFGLIGLSGFFIIFFVSSYYNNNESDTITSLQSILLRTFLNQTVNESIILRITTFINYWIFSPKAIFSVPLLIIVIGGFFTSDKRVQTLSALSFSYLILSFFIFKNGQELFPLIFDYFIGTSVIVTASVFNYMHQKFFKSTVFIFICFTILNFAATISYNLIKHENINKVLQADFPLIIPEGSKVFGPLRFWFFAPNTYYISDHYLLDFPDINTLDYVITNSVDEDIYPTYSYFEMKKCSFILIYSKHSKQYGNISVFKRKAR